MSAIFQVTKKKIEACKKRQKRKASTARKMKKADSGAA